MLRVRFSASEWNALQALTKTANRTMSELVRDHLGKLNVRNRDDEKRRTEMLNRINANLNMIARWVNTYKSASESAQVVSHLIAIDESIKELAK